MLLKQENNQSFKRTLPNNSFGHNTWRNCCCKTYQLSTTPHKRIIDIHVGFFLVIITYIWRSQWPRNKTRGSVRTSSLFLLDRSIQKAHYNHSRWSIIQIHLKQDQHCLATSFNFHDLVWDGAYMTIWDPNNAYLTCSRSNIPNNFDEAKNN